MADELVQEKKQQIFICGAKSIGQYGGYETFVDKLTEYLQDCSDLEIYLACKANGVGAMDESGLPGVQRLSSSEFLYHGAHCLKLPVPNLGPASAIDYDLRAMRFFLRYCREHRIESPVFYLLTCRIGPWMWGLKRAIKKLHGQLHVNPDGHEWMRGKWSPLVRCYWKLSERLTVKQADLLICDSVNIEAYIQKEYARFRPKTTYIAYGAETQPSALPSDHGPFADWMREKGLRPEAYYLIVGRFVPENNFETMIREFQQSRTTKPLAIITNRDDAFLQRLEQKLAFSRDRRIRFVGTVYDKQLLQKIRENAYGYLHGHEVGGTNPSLLEALGATKLNLLLDVGFNREVGKTAALYWTKEPGSLASLLERADALPPEEREDLGRRAKERIQQAFTWQGIADRYKRVWRGKIDADDQSAETEKAPLPEQR